MSVRARTSRLTPSSTRTVGRLRRAGAQLRRSSAGYATAAGGGTCGEANGTAVKSKRIYDPIHGFIELDAGEVRLLSSPAVQRLRRLRQLGLAYLAFPSAEHSRFSHALGALAIGSRAFDELRVHSPGAFDSERAFGAQRRLLRAGLLLHDIGHGPFSHACEAVLGVRHEARTEAMLAQLEMRDAIAALDVDPAAVLGLITGTADADPVLRELVSGPIWTPTAWTTCCATPTSPESPAERSMPRS